MPFAEVVLSTVDGRPVAGPLSCVTLADGTLAVRTDIAVPERVLVRGEPHATRVVRSGRAYAEARARLGRSRRAWLTRRRSAVPVVLLVRDGH